MADGGKDSHGGTGTRRIKIGAGIRFETGVGKKSCLTCIEKRILFSKMQFVPGDESKQSLKERGLNFEMIIEAIATNGIVSAYYRSKYPSQVVLIVNINGYMHCVPCERRGKELRLITAWPSRKYQKKYL